MATRDQIIAAADRLFYEHGYEHTSFAHVARAVNISRGNFYHHFKTKDEILAAVIRLRMEKTREMLERWEAASSRPADRIKSFIHILIMNRAKIKLYGCPVGSLCGELAKLNHVAQEDANQLYTLFRNWLGKQFTQLGQKKNADELALHLLARTQGVAALANAFQDDRFIRQEVRQMCEWLDRSTHVYRST